MTTQDVDRIRFVTRHFNELQGLRTTVPLGLFLLAFGLGHSLPVAPLLFVAAIAILLISVLMRKRLGAYYQRTFGEVERLPAAAGVQLSPLSASAMSTTPMGLDWRSAKTVLPLLIPVGLAAVLLLGLWMASPVKILAQPGAGWNPWFPHTPLTLKTSSSLAGASGPGTGPMFCEAAYVVCGGIFVGIWLVRERRRSQSYYLAFAALLLGLATLGAGLGIVLPALSTGGAARVAEYFLPFLAHYSLAELLCGTVLVIVGLLDHLQIVRVLKPAVEEPS
jgi:hypothetical protein